MYESKNEALISGTSFAKRLALHLSLTVALLVFSLGLGIGGYMYTEGMNWLDAFLNASMLLGGMGPVNNPKTDSGKFFAGCYALYAGLLFVVCAGLVLTPVLHRVLHIFHVTEQDDL